MRKFLEDTYGSSIGEVTAEQYPPPPMGVMAVQVAGVLQVLTIVLLVAGENCFKWLGIDPIPLWYKTVEENKMLTFGAVWMGNNVAAQMVATGAFEISVDGKLIFSKLESGRMPNAHDVTKGLADLGLTMDSKQARRIVRDAPENSF